MHQIAPPPPATEQPYFDVKKDPLCTPYVQVPDLELNPIQSKRLYKEQLILWLDKNNYINESYRIDNCGQNFVRLKCSEGHEKYARLHCGREYCPTCGKKGSRLHRKRTFRAMDRLIWAPVLGYLVFTLPDEISHDRPGIDSLKMLSKKAWDLTSQFFKTPGGMVRTHLMGNQLGKFHIHINILFPVLNDTGRGMVEPEVLDGLRQAWTKFVNKEFKMSHDICNIYYNFATTKRKIIHKIKYVVRPILDSFQFYTLKDEDRHYVLSLNGWHNTRWFGKLANCEYKKFLTAKGIAPNQHEDKDPHLSRRCPVCGNRYRCIDIIHMNNLPKGQLRYLDNDTLVDFSTFSYLQSLNT